MLKKILLLILIVVIVFLDVIIFMSRYKKSETVFGVSFSPIYANYLGLDYKKTYSALLDDYNFKYIRLSAQWDWMEWAPGKINFSVLDWMMDEAAKRDAKVIIAVGQKTPRWPECHIPEWAKDLSEEDYQRALQKYVAQVVERYKDHPALEIWQIENEPFLMFGKKCRTFTKEDLKAEIALVKKTDPKHKTLTSDSGELSTWSKTARVADYFGTTMYRVVWSEHFGYWNYDWLPVGFYRLKLWLNHRSVQQAFISELQAEPWIPNQDLRSTTIDEQYKSMSLERLDKNVLYARSVAWPRAYLWGAEWWAWLTENNYQEIPDYIKILKKK